jgi:hypothetical protein
MGHVMVRHHGIVIANHHCVRRIGRRVVVVDRITKSSSDPSDLAPDSIDMAAMRRMVPMRDRGTEINPFAFEPQRHALVWERKWKHILEFNKCLCNNQEHLLRSPDDGTILGGAETPACTWPLESVPFRLADPMSDDCPHGGTLPKLDAVGRFEELDKINEDDDHLFKTTNAADCPQPDTLSMLDAESDTESMPVPDLNGLLGGAGHEWLRPAGPLAHGGAEGSFSGGPTADKNSQTIESAGIWIREDQLKTLQSLAAKIDAPVAEPRMKDVMVKVEHGASAAPVAAPVATPLRSRASYGSVRSRARPRSRSRGRDLLSNHVIVID